MAVFVSVCVCLFSHSLGSCVTVCVCLIACFFPFLFIFLFLSFLKCCYALLFAYYFYFCFPLYFPLFFPLSLSIFHTFVLFMLVCTVLFCLYFLAFPLFTWLG